MQQRNPRMHIVGGLHEWARILGNDPRPSMVTPLLEKGWLLVGEYHKGGSWRSESSDWDQQQPWRLHIVKIPAGLSLSDEELDILPWLSSGFYVISAAGIRDADRLAKALTQCNVGHIDLGGSDLTDSGLRTLHDLSFPGYLSVRDTKVSPEAVTAFHARFPNCRIWCDRGTIEPLHQLPRQSEKQKALVPN